MKIRIPRTLIWDPGSLPMALLLGVTIWVVARVEQASFVTLEFPQPIPLTVRNLPSGLVLVGQPPAEVTIAIRAPQSILGELSLSDFQAYLDLGGLSIGTYGVSLGAESQNREVRVAAITPPEVTVTLDLRSEKTLEVEVDVQWDEPAGFTLGETTTVPSEVLVAGPQALVGKVSRVVAQLSLVGQRSTEEDNFPLIALDESGTQVSGVQIEPSSVEVIVPIEPRLGFKEVAVKPVTSGRVASGYWISDIRVTPSTVTLFGDPEVVSRLAGFLETEPIDVEGAAASLVAQVGLGLSPGLELFEVQNVTVAIEISPVLGGQTILVTSEIQGLNEGLSARISQESVEVILSGPLPDLQALEAGDVRVILDLSRLGVGTYRITPQVEVPSDLQLQSILPAQIEVVITEKE